MGDQKNAKRHSFEFPRKSEQPRDRTKVAQSNQNVHAFLHDDGYQEKLELKEIQQLQRKDLFL